MSDEDKNEEKDPINFDDEKEPIDSIEKTVENLKKKIQELSEEEMNAEKEHPSSSDEAKEKITSMYDSATKTISNGINELKDKAVETSNSEEMK